MVNMQQQTWNATTIRGLRGILAEERITHTTFARACGLSRVYLSKILSGTHDAGELASIKIARGIAALHLGDSAAEAEEAPRGRRAR